MLVAVVAVVAPVANAAQIAVRPLSARVHDDAGLLSAAEASALEAKLEGFERETGHQIVVLTVAGLEGEAIESFSLRVAEAWQIGDAGRDDGAIVIVSAADRRARIEVGYGLEGVVPDALAARILRERMVPHFREGRFGAGIVAGCDALMTAARGEVVPGLSSDPDSRARERSEGPGIGHIVFLCAFVGGFLGGQFGRKRRVAGSLLGGGVAGVLAWVLTVFLPGAVFAAIAAFLLSAIFSGGPSGSGLHSGPRGWRTGGYDGPRHGGFGGGFGGLGGGGFGGGGFGGGGGGFGGGGASGSW